MIIKCLYDVEKFVLNVESLTLVLGEETAWLDWCTLVCGAVLQDEKPLIGGSFLSSSVSGAIRTYVPYNTFISNLFHLGLSMVSCVLKRGC